MASMAFTVIFIVFSMISSSVGAEYVRGCYYTNWSQYRNGQGKFLPSNYQSGLCTHIFYAFAAMNEDFTLKAVEWNDEDTEWSIGMYHNVNNLKSAQPDLKILLSFGGWVYSQNNAALFTALISSPKNRARFIDNVIKFIRRINFDGFDLDWEYPGTQEKTNFALLVVEMRRAFDLESRTVSGGKSRLLLTAAVSAGIEKIDAGYDAVSLAGAFDFINIMSYDFHGTWEQKTGFNSPLFDRDNDRLSISQAAEHWHSLGVPKSKVIVGLAAYGRGWTLADGSGANVGELTSGASPAQPFTNEAGIAAYYEICNLIEQQGFREVYDQQQQAAYVVGQNVQGDKVWIGYDNIQSFNAKLDWLMQNGYGGAFVWALDMDDFTGQCASSNGQQYPLLNAIKSKLTGTAPPSVPGKSTKKPVTLTTKTTKTISKATTKAAGNNKHIFKCPATGVFRDPASCKLFYHCDDQLIPHKKSCPTGLAFNPTSSNCDWPQNVQC